MKLTYALSTLALALPLLVEASAVDSARSLEIRAGNQNANNEAAKQAQAKQEQQQQQEQAAKNAGASKNAGAAANAAEAAKASESAAAAAKASEAAAAASKGAANNNTGNKGAAAAAAASSSSAAAVAAAAATTSSAAAAATTTTVATGQVQNLNGVDVQGIQKSQTLDPSQLVAALAQDGQAVQEPGQVPSLTSVNNYINFCATQGNLPLTAGQQVLGGSCNAVPMGVIVAKAKMPASKFISPTQNDQIPANQGFNITMNIQNLETGNFVNAAQNYYSAPAQINGQGILIGHSHVTCQLMQSITQTTPLDPTIFAFFKGLNEQAVNGVLSANVANGLPAGPYRCCTINTASNHQPALVAVAQHGSLDDCVSFTAVDQGGNAGGNAGAAAAAATTAAAAAAETTAAAAAGGAGGAAAAAGNNGNKAAGGNTQQQQGGQQAKGGNRAGRFGRKGRGRGRF